MKRFIVIIVTCASTKEARSISGALLRKKLIACANIISGIESRFWWKGKLESAKESILILKAKSQDFDRIEKIVLKLHSYDVPEIIALPIAKGSKKYLEWIDEI